MELFVDLSGTGTSAASRDVRPWMKRALPVVPSGFGGAPSSRVRLADGAQPVGVVEGALTLGQALALGESESGMQRWRLRGDLVLTLLRNGEIQQASGTLDAVVVW